ncbi:hypothetical protein SDC9_123190 [bioreactor metagenome]|uniref:Uncharacterized protein n=1 Tax=bioreactor metagenome TaxID=1076179 RepID=A0A645CGY7_9ZZZZ
MALGSPYQGPAGILGKTQGTKRHALIELHIVADDRRLTDDGTGSVVDEEGVPDGCTRMDVYSCLLMGILVHHSGDERDIQDKELMGYPVDG